MSALDTFRAAYAEDDNEWWRTSAGELQNLFDEACERIDALTETNLELTRIVLDGKADSSHA